MSLQITQSHIPSFQVHLNSAYAALLADKSKRSHCYFVFNEHTRIPRAYKYIICLTECAIPCSWYIVNSTNNTLNFNDGDGGAWNITIPVGNWDATTIATYITSQGVNCEYIPATNKFSFTNQTNTAGDMGYSGAANSLFGLLSTITTGITYANPLISDTAIDLSGTRSLFIKSNLVVANLDSYHKGRSGILAKIPIDCNQGELLMYSNQIGFKTAIQTKDINMLEISIVDETHTEVDFNGLDWSMTLQFDVCQDNNDAYIPDASVPQLSSDS